MASADVLWIEHTHVPRHKAAEVTTLGDEPFVAENIDHKDFEGVGSEEGTKQGRSRGISRTKARERGRNEMKGWVGGRGRIRKRLDELLRFYEGPGPAGNKE